MSKIDESLDTQRKQLEEALKQYGLLAEMVSQLRGSITALEYVKTLGLVEPQD